MMEALKDEDKNDLLDLEEDDEEEDPLPATQEIIRTEPAPEAKQQAQSNQIWGTLIPMIQVSEHNHFLGINRFFGWVEVLVERECHYWNFG